MHRLVHIATRNWLRKNALFTHWIQRVSDHMQNMFPDSNHTKRRLWREYLPHALALLRDNEFVSQENHYLGLIENIADCLASDGRYQEAEVLYMKLMRINQENAGTTNTSTLISMANLASTYQNQGRWNEAEKLFVQVMETRKTVLGAEHPDTLTTMSNLAYTWKSRGKLQDALILIKNCSHLRSKVLGPSHPHSMSSSRAFSDWMDEHNPLQGPLLTGNSLQPLREVSAGSPAAVLTAQLTCGAQINLPYVRRRSVTKPVLGNHPLIIAARTTSPWTEIQDSQDVD